MSVSDCQYYNSCRMTTKSRHQPTDTISDYPQNMASTQQLPAPASEKGHDADSTQKEAHTAQQPASTESDSGTELEDATQYVQGFRLVCLIVGLILAVFCLGLVSASPLPHPIQGHLKSATNIACHNSFRIGPFSQPPFPRSRTSSILSKT